MHLGDDPYGITQRLYAYHYEESIENVVDEEKGCELWQWQKSLPSESREYTVIPHVMVTWLVGWSVLPRAH